MIQVSGKEPFNAAHKYNPGWLKEKNREVLIKPGILNTQKLS